MGRSAIRSTTLLWSLALLFGLVACIDDTPYAGNIHRIRLSEITGPGSVVCSLDGHPFEVSRPELIICLWSYQPSTQSQLTATATPDEGHTFLGWGGNVPSHRRMENPLVLEPDPDRKMFNFTAHFE